MDFPPLSWLRFPRRNPVTDLVEAHAAALMHGSTALDALLANADRATAEEAGDLFSVAERLSRLLVPVSPDERFVRALSDDLLIAEVPAASLMQRLRHLPRAQLAAAGIGGAATVTVTAGVVWIAWRSEGGLLGALRRRIPAA